MIQNKQGITSSLMYATVIHAISSGLGSCQFLGNKLDYTWDHTQAVKRLE